MSTLYPQLWKGLRLIEGLEKSASETAIALTGSVSSELFDRVKSAALALPGNDSVEIKIAKVMISMRDAHRSCGEKLAGSVEVHADMLTKLATAVFVDGVLESQCAKLAGDDLNQTRAVQSLGREYALHLMNGLLS
jgi:hypothetical protein